MRVVAVGADVDDEAEPADRYPRVHHALASTDSFEESEVTWAKSLESLSATLVGAECLIIVFKNSPAAPPEWLRALPDRLPKVVITPDPASTALALRAIRAAEILALPNREEFTGSFKGRIASASVLGRARSVVRHASNLSSILREWMTRVVDAFPPYGSIGASIEDFNRSSSTLRRHWRQKIGRSRPLTFLRWMLPIRVILVRSPRESWSNVAAILGVSRRRLTRAARDLADVPLDGTTEESGRHIREAYETYLARTLLRGR